MDSVSLAKRFKEAIIKIVDERISEKTRDCFRVRKAVITQAPSGGVCKVKIVGDETEITLPYSSRCALLSAGDAVWVGIPAESSSLRNAIVWEKILFN